MRMNMNIKDPFAFIIEEYRISPSQEELLRNTPLVGDYTHQSNVHSPVDADGSVSSAPVLVASPPPTQYAPQDVFHTPPEDLSLPSSDCHRGNLTGDADVRHCTLNQAVDLHDKSHCCVDSTEFSNCSKFVEKDSKLGFSDAHADETVLPRENVVGEGSGSKVEYGNVGVENRNNVSVFDVLKYLAEKTGVEFEDEEEDEGEYVGIGLLKAAKLAGITFPRPWYYPDDYESEFFNYDKGGGSK